MSSHEGAFTDAVVPASDDVLAGCLLRVQRDIAEFIADPPPGIFIAPEERDVRNINAIVMGSRGTPHEGGFFHFLLQCTDRYPLEPPKVRFMSTDGGRVRFNEHISKDGFVCLSALYANGSWNPAHSLGSVLLSIQSLLCDTPRCLITAADHHFESTAQHETIRVAVCDTVKICLQENSPFSQTLKDAVLKKFLELYDKYEGAVKSKMHLDGTKMNDPMNFSCGVYQFEALLMRLRGLKAKLTDEKAAAPEL